MPQEKTLHDVITLSENKEQTQVQYQQQKSYATLLNKNKSMVFMESKLTCANHSSEDVLLYQVGWNNFLCPKCGKDYSIGRKVMVQTPQKRKPILKHKPRKLTKNSHPRKFFYIAKPKQRQEPTQALSGDTYNTEP